jgi:SagB-type dehydrogenase family enzyme
LAEVSQLLWSAQGITAETGERAAPSAGATYPLETYLVVGKVTGLQSGIYKYQVEDHSLACLSVGDRVEELAQTTFGQECVREGVVVVIFTAIYERTRKEYGPAADMFVHMEVGHAAENLCLQAVALNLGTVCVAAFKETETRKLLQLSEDEVVLYMVPVGRMAE